MRAFAMGTGSGLIKIPNLFFSTVCCYYRYKAHLLDKGVVSVAAVVATVAEVDKPAYHFAALATAAVDMPVCHFAALAIGGKQPEAGSGWEDRELVGIVARALLRLEPEQGNWQPRCPFELRQ